MSFRGSQIPANRPGCGQGILISLFVQRPSAVMNNNQSRSKIDGLLRRSGGGVQTEESRLNNRETKPTV